MEWRTKKKPASFLQMLREARHQSKGLCLKLRILSPKLAALLWEFIYDERRGEYLCLSRNTPPVRYLELPHPVQAVSVRGPLRILGMIANPKDLNLLDVDRERERIGKAIEDLRSRGLLDLVWLQGQTWRVLQRMMRQCPWHIFHFIGHGGFDLEADEGLIALMGDEGNKHVLKATQFGRLLADHYPLRLALQRHLALFSTTYGMI